MEESAATTNLNIHSRAILNVQIRRAIFHSSTRYHFQQAPDTNMSSRQAIFCFIVAVLINFLQLKYQGNKAEESPFATSPLTMSVAVVNLLLYSLSCDAKSRFFPTAHDFKSLAKRLVDVSLAIFGPLSLAAMCSVLFPEFPCSFLFTAAIFYSLCQHPLPEIKRIWDWLQMAIENRFCGRDYQQGSRRAAGRVSVVLPRLSMSEHAFMELVDIGTRPPV